VRYIAILALSLMAFSGLGHPAFAHAHLVKSAPAKGAVLRTAPTTLTLWFSEPLEPAFSTIEVFDQAGQRVDDGKAALDPADPKVLRIALKPLAAGGYKVVWRVVSIDTHKTDGDFAFTVRPLA
jgi:methionine-rich copper-binding protein CopC